ncbi:transposase [Streptomyces sp. Z26]|uniref:transposase n=1 Tax=Streptomyces sp. Z26 TaxID=2500177 RepID=UPI000EF170C7|nr:transposase [Streptomyces sp. Z26]RLL65957.1 hypothetical protein D7M15_02500 [Streptomyces sp. Z26]
MSGDLWREPSRDTDDGFDRAAFVEEMGLLWEAAGSGRMDGRIIAYLLVTDVPYVSSAQLAAALRVSAGSISLATRRLAEAGFLKRHAVPGERSRYFRVDDDVWGGFLAGERRYLDQQQRLAERALALLGPDEEAPRRRLRNMRDYMRWVQGGHRDLLARWHAYQRRSLAGEGAAVAPESRAYGEGGAYGVGGDDRGGHEPGGAAVDGPRRPGAVLGTALARRLLPDALWGAAEPLLADMAPTARTGGPRGAGRRAELTAVVHVLTSGCGWQQLPDHFGPAPATAHRRFTAWSDAGFWPRWADAVASDAGVAGADVDWCRDIARAAANRRTGGRS